MHRTFRNLMILAIVLLLAVAGCAPQAAAPAADLGTLRIAVLPIVDALPFYVAESEGLFAAQGLNVELIPVASAPERVQLMAAGEADGTINETLSVMLFNREAVQMQVVRYAFRPYAGTPHFYILAAGQSGISDPQGLKNTDIGLSQGTVIEYVTDRLLEAQGFSADEIQTIAVPSIADRMALLASGELPAGVLPDPLASLAIDQGAVSVLDDSEYPEYGFSVISFRKAAIDENPEAIRAFLLAVEEATQHINSNPADYISLLSDQKVVPPQIQETYQVPQFPAAGVPSEAEWNDAMAWALDNGLIPAEVSYADSVNASFLP